MNTEMITIHAVVEADAKKVWEYYTDPQHITKWNFASDDWHCPSASNDMRVGGIYSARMEAKDGSWGFDFGAVYDEINEGKSFRYTIGDGRKVSVRFDPKGDATELIITFEAETVHSVEMQRAGWQSILNNFKKYTEAN